MTRIWAGQGPGLAKLWGDAARDEDESPGYLALVLAVQEEFRGALDDEPGLVVAAVGVRGGSGCSGRGLLSKAEKSACGGTILTAP